MTEILIDIRTCDMTLSQVMDLVTRYQDEHPDRDVWMDGDLYAIVSEARA